MTMITDQKAKSKQQKPIFYPYSAASEPSSPARKTSSIAELVNGRINTRQWGILIIGLLTLSIGLWIIREQVADWLVILSDQETVSATIQSFGILSPLALAFFQFLQVIVAFIPGHVFVIAGGYIYGFPVGFLLNIIFVVTASQTGFLLARWAGRPVVNRLAAPETLNKWHRIAEERGFIFFTIAFILPVFPTDVMNFVAGLTGISGRKFLAANFLGRLPSVIMLTLIGSHGLELSTSAWAALAFLVAVVYITGRYAILRIERRYSHVEKDTM